MHSIYASLHLLTPNSQSVPLPPLSCLATTSLFSVSVSLFLFCRWVHLCRILDSTYKWYHMVFVFLFRKYFLISRLISYVTLNKLFELLCFHFLNFREIVVSTGRAVVGLSYFIFLNCLQQSLAQRTWPVNIAELILLYPPLGQDKHRRWCALK